MLFLCNAQCCFHFRKNFFLTTTNKTEPKVSPVIESSGQECPAVVLTIRPKSRFNGEITKPAWTFDQNFGEIFLWFSFFCHDFNTCVAFDTNASVLFVTVVKCKKEQKKKAKRFWECYKPELNVYVLMSIFVESVVCILSSRSICYRLIDFATWELIKNELSTIITFWCFVFVLYFCLCVVMLG